MNLEIIRLTDPSSSGPTLGVLLVSGTPVLATLELPFRNNAPNVSCIPAGNYVAKKVENRHTYGGQRIPVTLEVIVPDRSGILFHIGNTVVDSRGCILLGMEFASHGVMYSRVAMDKFMEVIFDDDSFSIGIQSVRS